MKLFFKTFIILMLFTLSQPAFCQKLPSYHDWYTKPEIRKNYPEYTEYFEEYTSRLYDNLKIKENFPWYTTLGVDYYYTINKDGSISDFKIYTACDEYIEYTNKFIHPFTYSGLVKYSRKFEDYVKKVIYENPPKPFPQDIEYEKMNVELEIILKPINKKEIEYLHKDFLRYQNINKNKTDICAFDMNGGNTTTYNTVKKTNKFIPPRWDIKIYKFK